MTFDVQLQTLADAGDRLLMARRGRPYAVPFLAAGVAGFVASLALGQPPYNAYLTTMFEDHHVHWTVGRLLSGSAGSQFSDVRAQHARQVATVGQARDRSPPLATASSQPVLEVLGSAQESAVSLVL